jgi:hypothetical protein
MGAMWKRRLLSTLVVVFFAWVGAKLDVQGYGVFVMVAVVVPAAMFAGLAGEAWLRARRRRSLG